MEPDGIINRGALSGRVKGRCFHRETGGSVQVFCLSLLLLTSPPSPILTLNCCVRGVRGSALSIFLVGFLCRHGEDCEEREREREESGSDV